MARLVIYILEKITSKSNVSEDINHRLSFDSDSILVCCRKGALVAYKASSSCLFLLTPDETPRQT
jgi:hypothetical protein